MEVQTRSYTQGSGDGLARLMSALIRTRGLTRETWDIKYLCGVVVSEVSHQLLCLVLL